MNRFSSPRTVSFLRMILVAGAALLLSKVNAAEEKTEGPWTIRRYQDRDYITARSIQQYYHFDEEKVLAERTGPNAQPHDILWLVSPTLMVKAPIGTQDIWFNSIRFKLNDPVEEVDGVACISGYDLSVLVDPLLRPVKAKNADFDTVVIDPGHGGKDAGGKTVHETEKDLTLKLAKDLKADLEKRGLKVVMTRTRDSTVTDQERVAEANKVPHSIFISLHYGCHAPNSGGVGTYVFSPRGGVAHPTPGTRNNSENLQLACVIQTAVQGHFKAVMLDRGIEQAPIELLKDLNAPAILLEPGVMSFPSDNQLVSGKTFSAELAQVIGDAIMKYRKTR